MSNIKKKRILVTGAKGFIGSGLCGALREKGYEVVGIDKEDADIADFENVLKIFKKEKPEAVFHTAAVLPDRKNKFSLFFRVNVLGTLNILEACRLAGVKNFVYSSSMSVYGKDIKYLPVDEKHPTNPSDFYGLSKKMGEELVEFYAKQKRLSAIILRYSGVFGPGKKQGAVANFVENAALNKPLKIIENISWDIVYVGDIIKASIKALEIANGRRFEIINIGSGKEIDVKALAEKIIKITGSKSKIIMPNKSLPCFRFYFNINKAKRLLKFKPLAYDTSLEANVAEIKLDPKQTERHF